MAIDESIRQYGEGQQQSPLAVVILAFEQDYRTRKGVDGVEKQEAADKVVLGKIGDPRYRQEYWISRLSGPRCDDPRLWNDLVKPAYEAWKKGEELVQQGTPLAILGFISPRVIQQYRLNNVHTVEQLAAVQDGDLPRFGLEGRKHRDLAVRYLETANSETAKIMAKQREQDEENARLRAELDELKAALREQAKASEKSARKAA